MRKGEQQRGDVEVHIDGIIQFSVFQDLRRGTNQMHHGKGVASPQRGSQNFQALWGNRPEDASDRGAQAEGVDTGRWIAAGKAGREDYDLKPRVLLGLRGP